MKKKVKNKGSSIIVLSCSEIEKIKMKFKEINIFLI